MRNMTLTNARLTTGDPLTYERVRLVVRRGTVRASDTRGRAVWEAVLSGWERTGKLYVFHLVDGADATAESLGCHTCGH